LREIGALRVALYAGSFANPVASPLDDLLILSLVVPPSERVAPCAAALRYK